MLSRLLCRLTLDQWRAIDAERRTQPLPNFQAAAILLTAAVSLILPHYWGGARHFQRELAPLGWFADWPLHELHPHLYWAAFKTLNYGLLPWLCVKFALGGNIGDFGVRFVRERRAWLLYAAMVAVVVPMAYAVSHSDAFLRTYPKYSHAGRSWEDFLLWEVAYGYQFFLLEFFFRGFLLFGLARSIGSLSIFVMIVPYAMIHFGKPPAECLGSILAGVALGTIALRTGSIYGGVAVHCAVAWSMDIFALAQKGAHLFR